MTHSRSHISRPALVLVAALAVIAAASGMTHPIVVARGTAMELARQLGSLSDAIDAGLLDSRVVEDIAARGEATAIVRLDVAPVLAELEGANGDDAVAAIDGLDAVLVSPKKMVLSRLGEGAELLQDFDHLGAMVVRFRSEASLLSLLRLPVVQEVTPNSTFDPALDESMGQIRQPQVARDGYLGEGTYVGILDTGVDYSSYPEYFPAGSIAGTREVAPNDQAADDHGHGTHVASTVLMVAPGSKLFVADVFHYQLAANGGWENLASEASILAGMDWMIGLRRAGYPLRAVNLSLGGGHYQGSCNDGYGFAEAHAVGIIPVVAAGNSAYEDDAGNTTVAYQPGIGHPACSQYALAVGASTDGSSGCDGADTADSIAYFSQASSELDLLAPGACITAAGGNFQGTSMAAPHVAGAAAILAAARPFASANDIRTALFSSGPAITDARSGITRNRLDVQAALSKLLGTSGATPTDSIKPVVVAPTVSITAGSSTAADGRVSMTVRWSATDAGGIARYALSMRSNGSAWTDVTLPDVSAGAANLWLSPGTTYQFAANAQDRASNWGSWAIGASFKLGTYAENHASVSFTGSWTRSTWTSAQGQALSVSSEPNAHGCIRFQGSAVAWVSTMASNRGVARVWLDGSHIASIELHSAATRTRTVAFSRAVASDSIHTLCIQVAGTSGRPAVDIDAFIVAY